MHRSQLNSHWMLLGAEWAFLKTHLLQHWRCSIVKSISWMMITHRASLLDRCTRLSSDSHVARMVSEHHTVRVVSKKIWQKPTLDQRSHLLKCHTFSHETLLLHLLLFLFLFPSSSASLSSFSSSSPLLFFFPLLCFSISALSVMLLFSVLVWYLFYLLFTIVLNLHLLLLLFIVILASLFSYFFTEFLEEEEEEEKDKGGKVWDTKPLPSSSSSFSQLFLHFCSFLLLFWYLFASPLPPPPPPSICPLSILLLLSVLVLYFFTFRPFSYSSSFTYWQPVTV